MHLILESLGKNISVLGNMGNSNTIFGVVFVDCIRLVNQTTSVVPNLLCVFIQCFCLTNKIDIVLDCHLSSYNVGPEEKNI